MRILSPEILTAVVAYMDSPSPAALSALTRGIHASADPRSLPYLIKHLTVMMQAARRRQ